MLGEGDEELHKTLLKSILLLFISLQRKSLPNSLNLFLAPECIYGESLSGCKQCVSFQMEIPRLKEIQLATKMEQSRVKIQFRKIMNA